MSNKISEHDARQDFTKLIVDIYRDIYNSQASYNPTHTLNALKQLYRFTKGLLEEEEQKAIKKKESEIKQILKELRENRRRANDRQYRTLQAKAQDELETAIEQYLEAITDALHAHKLLLPIWTEDIADEIDFRSLDAEAGK